MFRFLSKGACLFSTLVLALGATPSAAAEDPHAHHGHHHHGNHDVASITHPDSLMGGHLHSQGDWMLSYKYMYMEMDGNREGTSRISDADVRAQGFMVVPTRMRMEMHMFGAMRGLTEDITFMAMMPHIRNTMDHIAGMPLGAVRFSTETEGFGDLKVGGMFNLHKGPTHSFHLNGLLSVPTGSIDEMAQTPAGFSRLPYPMQLGSGTVDFIVGPTYTSYQDGFDWGGQALFTIRTGTNDHNYRLGNEAKITGWVGAPVTDWLSVNTFARFKSVQDIHGADASLNAAMVPTADPERRGGDRLDLGLGVKTNYRGASVGLEGSVPVYQKLDGPQLETDYILSFTGRMTF